MKTWISISTAVIVLAAFSCTTDAGFSNSNTYPGIDFREKMRTLVIEIADYAHLDEPDFFVIPQNGQELLTTDGEADGPPASEYIAAIDGVGREDLYYGYSADNLATPTGETAYMEEYLLLAEREGIEVLVTDYCSTHSYMDDSYRRAADRGFVSFAAERRDLDTVPFYPPSPYGGHTGAVENLGDVRNFLYLINPSRYVDGAVLISALSPTEYDLFVVDLFAEDGTALTSAEVTALQVKPSGERRLVIAYMSIGEAEEYRYYWNDLTGSGLPPWILEENPDWDGNYKVEYWDPEWKAILFGTDSAYLDRIIAAGFDGVYLDIIDGFEYFEEFN